MIKNFLINSTFTFLTLTTVLSASEENIIKKGEYLAIAGDCYACHTLDNGQQYGGGVPFKTPFGTIYSKNISSDTNFGIGKYSYEEFSDAIRKGVSKRGNLYPAMPYDSFHLITDEDTKALYAYFMSTKAVQQKNKKDEMMFPFNIRFGIKAWSLINLKDQTFKENSQKSKAYNRGDYLVNSLGHCGACHTPRNITMGIDNSKHLKGNLIAGVVAPNITSDELRRQGWTNEEIYNVLKYGYSKRGTILGHMMPITYHSLSKLNDYDLNAIASYLLNSDIKVKEKDFTFNGHDKTKPAYLLYTGYCASCHGLDGQGIPNVAPALAGNGTLNHEKPLNTIYTIIYGIPKQRYSQINSFGHMPSFNLSIEELTQLVNYLQNTFTSLKNINHSQEEIMKYKKEVIKGVNDAGE